MATEKKTENRGSEAGFSLIEMMVILLVIAAVTGIVTFGSGYLPEVQINEVTSALAA